MNNLNFQNLKNLDRHIDFISLKTQGLFFAVWGCIRDILLWIDEDPQDIDFTTNLDPETLWKNLSTNKSTFRSAKFWTVSLIHWEKKYEITPLRQEWWYMDFRHPEQINWTKNVMLDSIRRDFTINCLYYFKTNIDKKIFELKKSRKNIKRETFFENISKYSDENIYLSKENVLILNVSQDIENIFWSDFDFDKLSQFNIVWEEIKSWFGILINPQNWLSDIQKSVLKAVWNPDSRFQEDALRIIRWVRLINKLNQNLDWYIDFETSTWISMKKNYYLVRFLAKERLKDELTKIFSLSCPFEAVVILNELNLLETLFPSLQRCKNVPQPVRYHSLDTYHHSIMTLFHLQKLNSDYLVKLAMLLHDVWKPDQYYYAWLRLSDEERNKLHSTYVSHPTIWKDLALRDLKNLGFSNYELEQIWFYIQYHMLALEGSENSIKNKIKKYIANFWYEKWMNLLDIIEADRLGQYNVIQKDNISSIENIRILSKDIYTSQGEFWKKNLVIDWNWIMKNFDLKPWKQVWDLLQIVFDWVIIDVENRNNEKSIFDLIKQNI